MDIRVDGHRRSYFSPCLACSDLRIATAHIVNHAKAFAVPWICMMEPSAQVTNGESVLEQPSVPAQG